MSPKFMTGSGTAFDSMNDIKTLTECAAEECLRRLGVPFTTRPDGMIEATGDIKLAHMHLDKLPDLTRVILHGDFLCSGNKLKDLARAPQTVHGSFICSFNKLETLQSAPRVVDKNFACHENALLCLEGGPESVGGTMHCDKNPLADLIGAPKAFAELTSDLGKFASPGAIPAALLCKNMREAIITLKDLCGITAVTRNPNRTIEVAGSVDLSGKELDTLPNMSCVIVRGDFNCSFNTLTNLVGAPAVVYGNFSCNSNNLSSLAGAPRAVGKGFSCYHNNLKRLDHAPDDVGGEFTCWGNELISLHGLPKTFIKVNSDFGDYDRLSDIPPRLLTPEPEVYDIKKRVLWQVTDGAPQEIAAPEELTCAKPKKIKFTP